jgi:hypothetical protein
MTNYYFLASLCPPLALDVEPEMSFSQFMGYLRVNLTAKDFKKAQVIQLFVDLYNLRAMWLDQPLDPRGSRSKLDMQDDISTKTGFDDYILDFLDRYDNPKAYIKAFPSLIDAYFTHEEVEASGFLKEYLKFERDSRLIMAAYRAFKLKKDLLEELSFEDPQDLLVQMLIVQKDAKTFEVPEEYERLKNVFEKYNDNPLDQFKALCQYRFDKVEEMKGDSVFTIDALLAYLVELLVVEGWQQAKQEKGYEIIESIVKVIK